MLSQLGIEASNPFTPAFGVVPPLLVGRDQELIAFRRALAGKVGDPGRAMLVMGQRGTGKTVLLNTLEGFARDMSWAVISETAHTGLIDDLVETTLPRALAVADSASHSTVTSASVSVLGIGASIGREEAPRYPYKPNFRSELEDLADLLAKRGAGVLVTVDEVQRAQVEDLRIISQAVQHCFRAGRPVAFIAAGLPSGIRGMYNDEFTTFLRRAVRFDLGELTLVEAERALQQPISEAGKRIGEAALEQAGRATGGFPFLVQAIGYQLWDVAGQAREITGSHVKQAVALARARAEQLLIEPILADLTERQRDVLEAMAVDDGPSRSADLAARLGVDQSFIGKYRRRLAAAEVVEPAGRGRIAFAVPMLRDYLRAHPTGE
jgi:type II secretory pathway predicted ATPase ExeA